MIGRYSFIFIWTGDHIGIFEYIKFVNEYFLNKIFNVLAFLILIIVEEMLNLL